MNEGLQTIVLSRMEHKRKISEPVACIWLNAGTSADVYKAQAFAYPKGYRVYTFQTTEKDPLGKAKAQRQAEFNHEQSL